MASSPTARTNDRGGDIELLRTLPAAMSSRATVTTPGEEERNREKEREGERGGGESERERGRGGGQRDGLL